MNMQNILETQVTDLENLADSPIAIPMGHEMSGQSRQTSIAGSPVHDKGKRKIEDGAAHVRTKRNRYISIAWYVY